MYIAHLIPLIFLIGCSLLTTNSRVHKISEQGKLKVIPMICLDGDGHGIYKFENVQGSFRFESQVDKTNSIFSMGISVPLQGEELFQMEYKEALNRKVKIKNNIFSFFFDRVINENDLQYIRKFFLHWGVFLRSLELGSVSNEERNRKNYYDVKLKSSLDGSTFESVSFKQKISFSESMEIVANEVSVSNKNTAQKCFLDYKIIYKKSFLFFYRSEFALELKYQDLP